MHRTVFAGFMVVGLGAIILLRGGSFTTPHRLLMIGTPVPSPIQSRQCIPPWVGGVVVVAGIALLLGGTRPQWRPAREDSR